MPRFLLQKQKQNAATALTSSSMAWMLVLLLFNYGLMTQSSFSSSSTRMMVSAFVSPMSVTHPRHGRRLPSIRYMTSNEATTASSADVVSIDEIRSMRVKQLKEELTALQISTTDVFEKEELVERLYQARLNGSSKTPPKSSSPASSPASSASSASRNSKDDVDVIHGPLFFTGLDEGLRIAAVNVDGGITVEPGDQPYVTIQIEVKKPNGESFPLSLLLDTACSGFVLRPSVVDKYNLPKLNTPITMTGAGGTAGNTGLTQIDNFTFGGHSFGPLPAAVQDIGALPKELDGIIGLSFLNQFVCVEMDFINGDITLYKTTSSIAPIPSDRKVVAKGYMEMIPTLGIYTTNVMLGTRGPVSMLVDTGAASTFLNWYGIENGLKIDRNNNSFLERISNWGAMGSDNVSMQLTHRINVSSTLNLSDNQQLPGISLKDNNKRLSIDIGDIAILDSLRGQNVGGILGIDVFMRCSGVRMYFQGQKKEILLLD